MGAANVGTEEVARRVAVLREDTYSSANSKILFEYV